MARASYDLVFISTFRTNPGPSRRHLTAPLGQRFNDFQQALEDEQAVAVRFDLALDLAVFLFGEADAGCAHFCSCNLPVRHSDI